MGLKAEIKALEERVAALEARCVASQTQYTQHEIPNFTSAEEYMDCENHQKNVITLHLTCFIAFLLFHFLVVR